MTDFLQSMPLAVVIIALFAGFVLLVKGADWFVDGSSSVAKRLKVPSIIIGLTIVAMGTSLPETAVSVTASLGNANSLAISNAVGSNIFNLMAVIGFCALITAVNVADDTLKRDFPISVAAAILLLVFGYLGMNLSHLEGAVFLVLFAGFIYLMVRSALKARKTSGSGAAEESDKYKTLPVWKCILFIIIGIAGIAIGGDFVVDSASILAEAVGMSPTLVGLTIVSIGTSLPELVTSIVAARKNEVDMALGNAIGSNIFNILMVLGIAAAISPIEFLMENVIDIAVLLVFSLIVWLFAFTRKKLCKAEGAVMLALYGAYMIYICLR